MRHILRYSSVTVDVPQPPEEVHRARSMRYSASSSSFGLMLTTPTDVGVRASDLDAKTVAQLAKGTKQQRAIIQRLQSLEVRRSC